MCRDYLKNRKFRDNLVEIIKEAGAEQGTSKAIGALLCEVANKVLVKEWFIDCHRIPPYTV